MIMLFLKKINYQTIFFYCASVIIYLFIFIILFYITNMNNDKDRKIYCANSVANYISGLELINSPDIDIENKKDVIDKLNVIDHFCDFKSNPLYNLREDFKKYKKYIESSEK